MDNPTKMETRKDGPQVTEDSAQKKETRRYETPTIQTFTGDQILEEVGPAQGYNGSLPGTGGTPF